MATLRPVLYVSGEYPPAVGGVGDYTVRLRVELASRGFKTGVLTGHGDPTSSAGNRVDDRPAPGGQCVQRQVHRWDFRALVELARAAPPRGIVHVQYQPAAFGLRGEICLAPFVLRTWRPDLKIATTFHDIRVPYLFPKAGRFRVAAVRLLARGSHAVLAADPADLVWLGAPSLRNHLVPIGSNVPCNPPANYDRRRERERLGLGERDLAVAYFGFLNQSKGLDTLVRAFSHLAQARPSARLMLLGGNAGASDPTDKDVAGRFLARLSSHGHRIIQPGFQEPSELSATLLAADVALLPYADGASPRRGSLLACAVHGLPIVTTRGPGMASSPFPDLLACESGDAQALANAVLRVADDSVLRDRLRRASESLAASVTWERIAGLHVSIYQGLIE